MVHFCDQKHHVVVIGAGFGGLSVVRELEEPGVSITIIDRSNHHLFQPLLYQVAGASLPSAEIAWPVRSLFRHREDVRTLMAEVQDVDTDSREVLLKDGSRIDYCQQRVKSDPLTATTNGLILIHLVYSGLASAITPAFRFCFSR
ncbi:FAD-dependent oxidoreductase [Enterobacter hormaechei]